MTIADLMDLLSNYNQEFKVYIDTGSGPLYVEGLYIDNLNDAYKVIVLRSEPETRIKIL